MRRAIGLCVVLVLVVPAAGAPRRIGANPPGPFAGHSGSWKVTFENGAVETCDLDANGAASEKEPLRSGTGRAERVGNGFVIKFTDDRTERWTAVGGRMVVEHWCPSTEYPAGPRVLGIAERAQ